MDLNGSHEKLGPGTYSDIDLENYKKKKKSYTFGKALRKGHEINTDINIGPGEYSGLSNNKKLTPNWSFGKDKRMIEKSINGPSPGTYDTSMVDKKTIGSFSFRKEKRGSMSRPLTSGADVGLYEVRGEIKKDCGFTFGKEKRDKIEKSKSPGYYDIPSTIPDIPSYA